MCFPQVPSYSPAGGTPRRRARCSLLGSGANPRAPGKGIEPLQREPKSRVLPLDDPGKTLLFLRPRRQDPAPHGSQFPRFVILRMAPLPGADEQGRGSWTTPPVVQSHTEHVVMVLVQWGAGLMGGKRRTHSPPPYSASDSNRRSPVCETGVLGQLDERSMIVACLSASCDCLSPWLHGTGHIDSLSCRQERGP